MDVVWKVVTVFLNCRFTTFISFHDILHGFQACCGTVTASLEEKLLQQLMDMREEVLYSIFLELHK